MILKIPILKIKPVFFFQHNVPVFFLISSAKLQRQYQNHPILKISYVRLYLSKDENFICIISLVNMRINKAC